jgi:hypothetical protein
MSRRGDQNNFDNTDHLPILTDALNYPESNPEAEIVYNGDVIFASNWLWSRCRAIAFGTTGGILS